MSSQSTISARSQSAAAASSTEGVEDNFNQTLDHMLHNSFGLIESIDPCLFQQLRRYLRWYIWRHQVEDAILVKLFEFKGGYFWIREGQWSINWMNNPYTTSPKISEIMDSNIKRVQFEVPAKALQPFNEPSNSSSTPLEDIQPTDNLFTRNTS
ncbi:hypothetical protein C2S51_037573 [Perilla frutescens var. frutescens]|nr:hypothetical protein C2S51_037573 [Perilla frutescens var. frutescens]